MKPKKKFFFCLESSERRHNDFEQLSVFSGGGGLSVHDEDRPPHIHIKNLNEVISIACDKR